MPWIQERLSHKMNNIVSIKNLTISFKNNTQVVNDVNLEIPKGKTVAIVGESGSGKTLSALSILRLLPSGAKICLLYTSPSPRDAHESRMPSSA